jgi:hypothetical protein
VWEEDILHQLMEVLERVAISVTEDSWVWHPGKGDDFSVKSTYVFLDHLLSIYVQRSTLDSFTYKFIWKSGVPSKVSALAWQLLLDRIPTRENLRRRGIITTGNSRCPLCNEVEESACHLFLHCRYTTGFWYAIYRWFGVCVMLLPSLPVSYAMLVGCGSNKKRRKGLLIVWLAMIWSVWKARNNKVFNNVVFEPSVVVDLVHRLSWQWFVHNTAKVPCLLYEWVWNPGDCMLRRGFGCLLSAGW